MKTRPDGPVRETPREDGSRRRPRDEGSPPSLRVFAGLSAASFLAYLGASRAVREFLELAGTLWRRLLELAG